MPYLIDGHNLIPKIPGFSLRLIDDEQKLIQVLQDFCRVQRKTVDVYFDNASPGQPARQGFGQVTAYFVRQGTPADLAIQHRLVHMGKGAANWTVVSSDQAVQRAARQSGAKILSSDQFASLLASSLGQPGSLEKDRSQHSESQEDVEDWLKLFGE